MGRSAAVLLLTLVLGAFVAAHAGGDDNDWPKGEKNEKQCSLKQPFRYTTWECPTCKRNDHCVKTKCSDYDGKADVEIDLNCLFGGKIGFVAVSYGNVCTTNQKGDKKKIVLSGLKCEDLKNGDVELRFIVQNKWWYNSKGRDLESSDCCYDKCTHGKPCHTCEFKEVYIPACDNYNCKKPMCEYKNKHECPGKNEMHECFKYEPYEDYVKVSMKKDCHKRMKHVACSYYDYQKKDEETSKEHNWSDKDDDFWFKAACNSPFKWVFEDDSYCNRDKYAPTYPPNNDKCRHYFDGGKVCNQCGCNEPVYVPDCKKKGHGKGGSK
jgi:hypothetical protein